MKCMLIKIVLLIWYANNINYIVILLSLIEHSLLILLSKSEASRSACFISLFFGPTHWHPSHIRPPRRSQSNGAHVSTTALALSILALARHCSCVGPASDLLFPIQFAELIDVSSVVADLQLGNNRRLPANKYVRLGIVCGQLNCIVWLAYACLLFVWLVAILWMSVFGLSYKQSAYLVLFGFVVAMDVKFW
jgi:hypothetical protein